MTVEASGADADPVFQYMTGQMKSTQPQLLASYEDESRRAVEMFRPRLGVRYGVHPRQCFDLFEAQTPIGTLVYLHAGYWQSRDKAQFHFLAPSFVEQGVNVALVNYPLCPDVTLDALTEAVRDAMPVILSRAKAEISTGLVVAGHSAGAHLAIELALTDWRLRGFDRSPVSKVVAISGVYDLKPLLATPLNDKLRLDQEMAQACSPLHRAKGNMPPALFAVGGLETDAFHDQTSRMAAAWQQAGNEAREITLERCDHFSLLRSLQKPGGLLFDRVRALF
jgi:arylformamidase